MTQKRKNDTTTNNDNQNTGPLSPPPACPDNTRELDLYKRMFDAAPIGIASCNLDGMISGCNNAFEKIAGYKQEEILGRHISEITDPRDMETERLLFKQLSSGSRQSFQIDKRFIRKDGSLAYTRASVAIMNDENGRPDKAIGFVEDISEKQKTEMALRKSEEKFRTIFDASPDFIFLADSEGRILDANPPMLKRIGASLNELRKKGLHGFFAGDDPERIKTALDTLTQGNEVRGFEFEFKTADGGQSVFEINAMPLRGSSTSICMARDITLRKQTQRELREKNLFLQALIAHLPVAVFGKDPAGRFIVWNKTSEVLFGLSASEVMEKTDFDFFPADQAGCFQQTDAEIFRSREARIIDEEAIMTPKLGERWLHTVKVPLFDDDGNPVCLLGISEDITDRRIREQRIHLLAAGVEQSIDGIAMADISGKLLFVNQAWVAMHGFKSADEMTGRNISISHSQKQMEEDVIPFNHIVTAKGFNSGEVGHVRKNGELFPTMMTVSMIKETEHTPAALVAIARDITELKKAEEELRKHRDNLEEIVRERTEEHEAANLELQIEIAERKQIEQVLIKTQQESEFYLDLMFHDLTNFNQTALGFLSLLENKTEATAAQKKYIEYCIRQIARSENLISKVRAFSDVKNIFAKDLHPIELNSAISKAVALTKTLYPAKMPEINFVPAGEKIAFGTSLIETALFNIFENAIKHSMEGNANINIGIIESPSEPERYWEIHIADDGPGVPDGMKEKIFDRFQKIGKEKGMGLGLSLARAIVEKYDGRIWVEDKPDKSSGSLFIIAVLRAK